MPSQRPIDYLQQQLGREGADAALKDYLKTGGQNIDPELVAWCAAAASAANVHAGIKPSRAPLSARSYENWGESVFPKDENATPPTFHRGDVAVFGRDPEDSEPGLGHVAFIAGRNENGEYQVLGGNQYDPTDPEYEHGVVSVHPMDDESLIDVRRPKLADQLAMAMRLGDRQGIPSPGQDVSVTPQQVEEERERYGLGTVFDGRVSPQASLRTPRRT